MNQTERKQVTLEDVERRLIAVHGKAYFDWLRHLMTLAVAALTTLVALQCNYVPQSPRFRILLALGWATLMISIVAGIFALRAEYSTPLAAAKELRFVRNERGEEAAAEQLKRQNNFLPHPIHKWLVGTMVVSFLIAFTSVCGFAIGNLLQ